MSFLISLYRSLGNLAWLKQQKHAALAAWKYFLLLMVLFAALSSVPLVVSVPSLVREVKDKVMSNVPDFQATLKQGTLAVTGFPQPYVYRDQESGFVLVVDTVSTSSLSLVNYLKSDTDSGVQINREGVEMIDGQQGESKTQSWKNFPDFSVTKVEVIQKIVAYSGPGTIAFLMIILPITVFLVITLGKLWSILFVSCIVYLVSMVAHRGWKWSELFVVGLFATTLPSLIAIAFTLFGVQIGFIHFLALLAFMLAVVLTRDERVVEDAVSSEE